MKANLMSGLFDETNYYNKVLKDKEMAKGLLKYLFDLDDDGEIEYMRIQRCDDTTERVGIYYKFSHDEHETEMFVRRVPKVDSLDVS